MRTLTSVKHLCVVSYCITLFVFFSDLQGKVFLIDNFRVAYSPDTNQPNLVNGSWGTDMAGTTVSMLGDGLARISASSPDSQVCCGFVSLFIQICVCPSIMTFVNANMIILATFVSVAGVLLHHGCPGML